MMGKLRFYISVLLTMVILQSCTTPKDKAVRLVRNHIKESLYNPKSYNEASTEIDSLFSVDGTLNVYLGFMEVEEMLPDIEELASKIDHIKTSYSPESLMNSPHNHWMSADSYSKEKYDVLVKKMDVCKAKIQERMMAYLDNRFSEKEPVLAGFFIIINYSAKTLDGREAPGLGLYIVNSEANKLMYEKSYTTLEIAELITETKKPTFAKMMEYVNDYCIDSESFDVDEFISYMLI